MVIGTHDLERLGKVDPPTSPHAGKLREGPKGRKVSWRVYSRCYKTYPQIANPRKD